MPEPISVAAGTVTYGSRAELCIATVARAQECGADRVVIVDNGSEPGAADRLREYAESAAAVRLVRLDRNRGSAEGFRVALNELRAEGTVRVWLLDDDNLAAPDALQHAVGAAGVKGERAIIACYRVADPLQAAVVDGAAVSDTLQVPGSFVGFDLARRLRPSARGAGLAEAIEVPWAPYGGLLLPAAALDAVDPPLSAFVLYGDDRDWCERLRAVGFTIWLEPRARVDDAVDRWSGGATSGPKGGNLGRMVRSTDTRRVYYLVRNSVFAEFRLARRAGRLGVFLLNGVVFTGTVVATAARSRRLRFVPVFLRATVSGLRGRWYRTE